MSKAAAVPVIVRLEAGRPEAVGVLVRVWTWGGIVAVLMTLSLALLVEGAPGDLDPTFGVGGKVITSFQDGDFASDLVLQPDGKLVAAGRSGNPFSGEGAEDFARARYLPDGSLDPTFGTGGKVTTDFAARDGARALVLQPDGKLVAAGFSEDINDNIDFALARYLTDGRLDASFGTGGTVTTDVGGVDGARALVLQPDGKLGAAGVSGGDFALVRYLPDGRLDPTFGMEGKVTTDFGASALVLQPDGKLVAAGGSGGDFALARYLPDGRLDVSFGTGGKVTTDFGSSEGASALVLQLDGKLVAAGTSCQVDLCDFALARYLPDGNLDPTFGTGGKVTTDLNVRDHVNALVLQPDGKLVAAGTSADPFNTEIWPPFDFALARYLPDGRLDASFGTGGTVTTDFGSDDIVHALVLQPDGKLVAAGFCGEGLFGVFCLARYEGDESPRVLDVAIDIKPGSDTNPINPKSHGVIPVAILSTDAFDATTVDPLSVRFGPKGAQEAHDQGHLEDVDQDGEPDLVLHFHTQETGITCGETSATLTGETFDGDPIQGSDSIKTVGCK